MTSPERLQQKGSDPVRCAPAAARAPVAPRGLAALQRAVGNRAFGRLLSRWAAHPDTEKKGVMVPDTVLNEFQHFNPPQNK